MQIGDLYKVATLEERKILALKKTKDRPTSAIDKFFELVKFKKINLNYKVLCTMAIENKCKLQKAFETNKELQKAIGIYLDGQCSPEVVEELASNYRYPIGKGNVHKLKDFSQALRGKKYFNEDISNWDMSNAKT